MTAVSEQREKYGVIYQYNLVMAVLCRGFKTHSDLFIYSVCAIWLAEPQMLSAQGVYRLHHRLFPVSSPRHSERQIPCSIEKGPAYIPMGRGKGKGKRGGRGGGGRRHFVSSLEELEARNDRDEAWAARRKTEEEDDSDSDESGPGNKDRDGSDSDEGDSDGVPGASALPIPRGGDTSSVALLEQKKVKTKGVEGLIEVENPNAKPKSTKMMKAKVRTVWFCFDQGST